MGSDAVSATVGETASYLYAQGYIYSEGRYGVYAPTYTVKSNVTQLTKNLYGLNFTLRETGWYQKSSCHSYYQVPSQANYELEIVGYNNQSQVFSSRYDYDTYYANGSTSYANYVGTWNGALEGWNITRNGTSIGFVQAIEGTGYIGVRNRVTLVNPGNPSYTIMCYCNYIYSDTRLSTYNISEGISTRLVSPVDDGYDNNVTWVYHPEQWGAVAPTSCSLYAGGAYRTSNATDVVSGTDNTFTWTPSSDGVYSWYVSCLGNDSVTYNSSSRTFTYDTGNPGITIATPTNTTYSQYTAYNANITYTDTYNLSSCGYNITNGAGSVVESWLGACSGTSYNKLSPNSFTIYGEGTFTITAYVADLAGQTASTSTSYSVSGLNWHLPEWNSRIPYNVTSLSSSTERTWIEIPINATELISSGLLDVNCTSFRAVDENGVLRKTTVADNICNASTKVLAQVDIPNGMSSTIILYFDNTAKDCPQTDTRWSMTPYDDFVNTTTDWTKWSFPYNWYSGSNAYLYSSVGVGGGKQWEYIVQTYGTSWGSYNSLAMSAYAGNEDLFFTTYAYPYSSYQVGGTEAIDAWNGTHWVNLYNDSIPNWIGSFYETEAVHYWLGYNTTSNITTARYWKHNSVYGTSTAWTTGGSFPGKITEIRHYLSVVGDGGENIALYPISRLPNYWNQRVFDYNPSSAYTIAAGAREAYSTLYYTFSAYNENNYSAIDNFSVSYGSSVYTSTNGTILVPIAGFPATGAAQFASSGYAARTLHVNTSADSNTIFYSHPSTASASMVVDVRNSTNFSTEPNTWTELWYGCMKLHEGYSDASGLITFVGDPLKQYTMKYGTPQQTTTWQVEVIIGMIQDERTGAAVYADVVLNNGTMEVQYSNVTWVTLTRYQIANYSVPWGEAVSVLVGNDDYPAREYFITIDNTQRRRLIPRLLNIYDGVLVKFVVMDAYQSTIPDTDITARRLYGTVYNTVAQKTTDSAGQAQMFLDPYTRYQIHAEHEGNTYDGYLEPQAGVTYYIVLGSAQIAYVITSPVRVGYAAAKPAYGDNLTLLIYDTNADLTDYTFRMKTTGGVEFYNVSGSEVSGESFIVNTSAYPSPPNIFTPWILAVEYNRSGVLYANTFVIYFDAAGNNTGLSLVFDMASDNAVMGEEMRHAIGLIILIIAATSMAAVAPGFVLPFVIIAAVVLATVGFLNPLAAFLSVGAAGLAWYASRRGLV